MADWIVSGPLTAHCFSPECSASLIPVQVRGQLVVLLADWLVISLYLPLKHHQVVSFQIIAVEQS